MEERINVAQLLKDCPKGMELDCISYNGVVTLGGVTNNTYYPISINVSCNNENICVVLTEYGQPAPTMFNKCIIFPKGKTTWEGFQRPFKDGDVVTYKLRGSLVAFIYKERINTMCVKSHFALYAKNMGFCVDSEIALKEEEIVFATEEEKESLFKAIKDYGYRWYEETKTLEKLVESKEDTDDRVIMAAIYFNRENYANEVELYLGDYEIEIRDGKTYAVFKSKTKTLEKSIVPNFKIGDWVVNMYGKVNQVVAIDDICNGFALDNNLYFRGSLKDTYHLWTIQDAKEGDVLCDYIEEYNNPLIFILKKFEHVNFGLVKPSDYSSYCFLSAGDKQRFKEGNYHHKHNIKPATKEQRDLLFQKMKESGYEWDAEKKELNEIEPKSALSEEDEKILEIITSVLQVNFEPTERFSGYEEYMNVDLINWLRALKDRCTWKPSDKQMEQLGWIAEQNKNNMIGKELMTLYNDLSKR